MTSQVLSRYVGLPWAQRGRDPQQGLDCWGLVCHYYDQEYDIQLPHLTNDYQHTSPCSMNSSLALTVAEGWVEQESPRDGDVVLFRVGRWWAHVGILAAQRTRFLHVLNEGGSALQSLEDLRWNRRPRRYFRHRET